MEFLKISDFAKAIGVSTDTLRIWDKKGVLKPHHLMPNGTRNGKRIYSSEQIEKYLNGDYNGGEHRHLKVDVNQRRVSDEEII